MYCKSDMLSDPGPALGLDVALDLAAGLDLEGALTLVADHALGPVLGQTARAHGDIHDPDLSQGASPTASLALGQSKVVSIFSA